MAEIHEHVGLWISNRLSLPSVSHLRPQDMGELLVSSTVGVFFLFSIAVTYRWGDRVAREVSRSLIVLLVVLAFFGVFIDLLHAPTFLEDGSELIIMSFITCFVFSVSRLGER